MCSAIDISSTEPVGDTDFFYPLHGANPLPIVLREGNHKRNTMARDEPKCLLTIGFTLIKNCINGKKYPIDVREIQCRGAACCARSGKAFAVSENNTIFCGYQ